MARRGSLSHRADDNIEKLDGVFFGAAKLLYENADRIDSNRKSHPLLVSIERGDLSGVQDVLSAVQGKEKYEEMFQYVTDYSRNNALHVAVASGNIDIVKVIAECMLSKKIFLAAKNKDGDTPLHVALKNNNNLISIYLAEIYKASGDGVNQFNNEKVTALMISVMKRNVDVFDMLLPLSQEALNERNANYQSALHLACIDDSLKDAGSVVGDVDYSEATLHIVSSLLSQEQIQFALLDTQGKSPLHLACEAGNLEVAELLLRICKQRRNESYTANFLNHPVATALDDDAEFLGLQNKMHNCNILVEVKERNTLWSKLIDHLYVNMVVPTLRASWIITGAKSARAQKGKRQQMTEDVFKAFPQYSRVPLHLAFLNGHTKIVKFLLKQNHVDRNAVDKDGNNSAHFAAMSGNPHFFFDSIFQKIKYLCLDVDSSGNSILHKASTKGDESLISFLVKEFHDQNLLRWVNKNDETVLHTAARAGNLVAVQRYVSYYHMNVHARLRHDKYTALHLATACNNDKVMEFLLQHGADANAKNRNTVTPLRMAINKCMSKIDAVSKLSILIEYDVDVFIKKATNENALRILEYVADFPSVEEAQEDPITFEKEKGAKRVPFCFILLLKFLDHPHLFLNQHFDRILFRLHETARGPNLVGSLVILSLALKQAIVTHPLEELFLKRRFDDVEQMIVKVMESPIMDDYQEFVYMMCLDPFKSKSTVPRDLNLFFKREESNRLHCTADAKILIYSVGPLSLCIDHELSALCGSLQVASLTNASFWDHIRESCNHTLLEYVSMKSIKYSQNLDIRSRPVFLFFLEFLSSGFTLLLAASICIDRYGDEQYQPQNFQTMGFGNREGLLCLMILTSFLYEIGEFSDNGYNVKLYFGEGEFWNRLDCFKTCFYVLWFISKWMGDAEKYHLYGKGFLCVSCIPASLNLLRYISLLQFYGVLVIMLFKVGVDTINYITIFLICCFGFGICFMGLFPTLDEFKLSSLTFFSMFDYGMGNYDQSIYENSPYKNVGKLITIVYVVFTMIVIFNLLIARMADTYAKIDEKAFFQWAKALAKNGRSFMLLQERSPLCMLPPPLNIIPSFLSPFHYWTIENARKRITRKLRPPKSRANLKAVSEFKKAELMKLQAKQEENSCHASNNEIGFISRTNSNADDTDADCYSPTKIADEEYYTLSIAGTVSDWIINSIIIPIIFVVGLFVRIVEFSVKFFKLAKGLQKVVLPFVVVPFVFCMSVYYACSSLYTLYGTKCFLKFDTLAKDKYLNVKHGVKYYTATNETLKRKIQDEKFKKSKLENKDSNFSKSVKLNVQRLQYKGIETQKKNIEWFSGDDLKHIFGEILPSRYPSDTEKTDNDMMSALKRMEERLEAVEYAGRVQSFSQDD